MTENTMKEMIAAHGGHQNERAQFSERWKPARSRGASQNDVPRKQQRAGEAEAKGNAEDVDVMDLITPVHLQLSTQLGSRVRDLEAATYCTLSVPKESDIVTEMQNAGRFFSDMVTRHPNKERGSPHIWSFNAMLRATKKILTNRNKNGELRLPDQGKAEAIRILRSRTDDAKFFEQNTCIKACRHLPTFAKPGQTHRSRIIFAVGGVISYKRQKEADGHQRSYPLAPLSRSPLGTKPSSSKLLFFIHLRITLAARLVILRLSRLFPCEPPALPMELCSPSEPFWLTPTPHSPEGPISVLGLGSRCRFPGDAALWL